MEDQELDSAFKRLGTSAPFRVDWDEYAVRLLRRLSVAERRRRRQSWWVALAGAVAGAAAAWLVTSYLVAPGKGERIEETAHPVTERRERVPLVADVGPNDVPSTVPMVLVRRPGSAMILRSVPATQPEMQPFVQRVVCEDGRVGEIRFHGFTPEGAEGPAFIMVGEGGPQLRPGMGL